MAIRPPNLKGMSCSSSLFRSYIGWQLVSKVFSVKDIYTSNL